MKLHWPRRTFTLIIAWTCIHFLAALISGVIAHGLDFDQLTSRSAASRMANVLHTALMAPHTAVIRAMPNRWLTQGTVPVIPILLFGHSLAWGVGMVAITAIVRRKRVPPYQVPQSGS